MDIKQKQEAVRAWMRKNKRRVEWYSLITPGLNDPICNDPLFKPLVLAESVFQKNNAFKKYWLNHLAEPVNKRLIAYENNDFESAFNVYLAQQGLVHEHHWNGAGYGTLHTSKQYYQIRIDYPEYFTFKLFTFAKINDTLFWHIHKGFLDKNLDIFKIHVQDKESNFNFKFVPKNHTLIMWDLLNRNTNKFVDSYLSYVTSKDSILKESFQQHVVTVAKTNIDIGIDLLENVFKLCSNKEIKIKLISELTGLPEKDLIPIEIVNSSISQMYKTANQLSSIQNTIEEIDLPLI